MQDLQVSSDPRHQVCVVTGTVDLQGISYGAGRVPWPWLVRGLSCRTSMLDANGTPTIQRTDIRLLVQGPLACESAAHVLQDGNLVTIRGSLVDLTSATGGKFAGLGLLVGSIYPILVNRGING